LPRLHKKPKLKSLFKSDLLDELRIAESNAPHIVAITEYPITWLATPPRRAPLSIYDIILNAAGIGEDQVTASHQVNEGGIVQGRQKGQTSASGASR